MKKKNKSYTVYFKLNIELDTEISAASYEDAIQKARGYDIKDLIDFDHSFNDGSIAVTGVYNSEEEPI